MTPEPESALPLFLTYLIHSTLVLVATWVVLRFRSHWSHIVRERMWKFAALVAFVTAPMALYVDLARPVLTLGVGARPAATIAALGETLVAHRAMPGMEAEFPLSPHGEPMPVRTPTPGASGEVSSTRGVAASPRPRGIRGMLVILAALFMVGGFFRILWQTRRLRLFGEDSLPGDREARGVLDELLSERGVSRRVSLLVSSQASEPLAFGIWRWRIVLPEGLQDALSREELRAVLAHELAHLVRGDPRWLWLGRLLCSSLAFQPLHFLARREWQRAAEFGCDDWAVSDSIAPLALAKSLTRVAEWRMARRGFSGALAATGSHSNLSSRIERLVDGGSRPDPWTSRSRPRVLAGLALAVVALLGLWGPRTVTLAVPHPNRDWTGALAWHELDRDFRLLETELERLERALRHSQPMPEFAERVREIRLRTGDLSRLRAELAPLVDAQLPGETTPLTSNRKTTESQPDERRVR